MSCLPFSTPDFKHYVFFDNVIACKRPVVVLGCNVGRESTRGEHTYIMGPRKSGVKGLLLRKNERADESSPISYLILAPEGKVKESEGKAASGQSMSTIRKVGMLKVVVV